MPEQIELVSNYKDVLTNVKQFNDDLQNRTNDVVEFLSMFKQWYYIEQIDSFGPSKYIGYKNMNIDTYLENHTECMDGRVTERVLRTILIRCEVSNEEFDSIKDELKRLLDLYRKKLRANAKITVIR